MQYLLTKEEYDKLLSRKEWAITLQKDKLQKLCTKIANEMPIKWGWGGSEHRPWGCIIGSDDWYCDSCPVITICPYDAQRFSK